MSEVLLQMAAIIVIGALWRALQPGGLDTVAIRTSLTSLVYYLLLPALVLDVLWRAELGLDTLRISLVASMGVILGMVLGFLLCRQLKLNNTMTGALILAAAFPNATYLGLPVLDATLGSWSQSVAIQYDLFACTPLLLTAGILIAKYYSAADVNNQESGSSAVVVSVVVIKELLKVPPLWAAIMAVGLNLTSIVTPYVLAEVLTTLSSGVVPLMLLSLGMSLRWDMSWFNNLRITMPVIAIQLLIVPMFAWYLAQQVGISNELLIAVTLEAAMPSMVLGILFCDRYGLDTSLYASTVTLSTFLSLFTLPLWFNWMQGSLNIFYGA